MKNTELRIGNLVKVNGDIVKVEQITKKKIGYHKQPNEHRMHYAILSEVEPIEITEDVMYMVKCRRRSEDGKDILHEIIPLFYVQTRGDNGKVGYIWREFKYIDAVYFHELQNWFYMFNRKELEVKL